MAEIKTGSDPSGSPIENSVPNPNDFGSGTIGETQKKEVPAQVDPEQYKKLETMIGSQGEELGEYRKFFSEIAPLLDKLDNNPDIVKAIVDEKITTELAKAVMEGKFTIEDAKIVKEAEVEVKKELGKDVKNTSAEDISKLIEDKASELKGDFAKELKERDEIAAFENSSNAFVAKTEDFSKYASEIDKWLDEHDNVTDIAVAYYAVKGELSEKEAIKQAEIDKVELEKSGASSMAGGQGTATRIKGETNVLDELIAGKSNPNLF